MRMVSGMDRPGARAVVEAALAEQRNRRLRAFIYSRTSSDRFLRRGSTRDQATENRRTCSDYGWDVVGEFEDPDLSASTRAKKPRPDWDDMVRRAALGECDVIVFWDSSRASRDLAVSIRLRDLCQEHRVLLCYNGDVYDMNRRADRKRFMQDAIQDEDEADRISERMLRTKRLAAERGAPHGRIPFGFKRLYDPQTGHLIGQVEDEVQAELLREAAARVVAGEALLTIVEDFQARRIPTAGGAEKWRPPALRKMLLNPAVAGQRVHQDRVVGKAAWDPIVDEVTFRKVKKVLKDPGRRTQHDVAVKHLLSGIAKCFCGGELRPVNSNGKKRPSYVCKERFCTGIAAATFEVYVEAVLLAWLERPELVDLLESEDGSGELTDAQAALEDLEAELAEALDLVGKRKLTVALLAKVEAQLLPQIEQAREAVRDAARPSLLRQVAGPGARAVWAEMDMPQRRSLLREAVRVTLHKAPAKGVSTVDERRVVVEWLK